MLNHLFTWQQSLDQKNNLQTSQKKMVFTNGCFDVLHVGHVRYLKEAKACGDFLLVALNTDESVKRLKGPSRPIFTLQDRAEVLLSLSCVDAIVSFDQDTPLDLLKYIQPPIYVKGGDYSIDQLPEYSVVTGYGGQVHCLSFYDGYSSSNIINKGASCH